MWPKLRFKDDDGREFPEWKTSALAKANIQVIDGDRGINYPNGNDFSDDGYCLFLNAKNVTKSGFVFNEKSFITKQKDELLRKGKLKRRDIVLTTRGTVGNIAYFDEAIKYENIRINSGMVIIRNCNKDVHPNFLYKYFDSPKFKKTIDQIAFGSAQPQLTVAEINKFAINFPVSKEQTKIANFLTAIDEKITQLTQKHDCLKQYKKGVMQQIFSQKLRFKDDDGREFPEWEEKRLGEVGEIITGKTPSTSKSDLWNGNIHFVTPSDITDSKYQHKTQRTITDSKGLKILPKKAIMFTCIASIGKMALSMQPCITNQQINSLIPNHSYDNEYIYYALSSISEYIKSTQANTTLPIINKTEFSKFRIPVPSFCRTNQNRQLPHRNRRQNHPNPSPA